MAVSIYAKVLPKDMVDEAREYQRLYRNNLTTKGTVKFKSVSSGATYTSEGGQQGMFNILKKALRDYIIGLGAEPKTPLATLTDANGTWTVPDEITQIDIFMVSGGKSGYSGALSDCRFLQNIAVTPGQTIDFSVGIAGEAGNPNSIGGTTTFGDYMIAPSANKVADLDHYYNPYDNTMYYPWMITEQTFAGQFDPPYEDYSVVYGSNGSNGSDGGEGFVGGKGGDAYVGQESNGGKGGNGYIGGDGGMPSQKTTEITQKKNGEKWEISSGVLPQTTTRGGNGGIGEAQGGDGGRGRDAYIKMRYAGEEIRCDTRAALRGGNGGDGGNGGNGGNGGGGAKSYHLETTDNRTFHLMPSDGGNGGNATRWGGTGGAPGKGGSLELVYVTGGGIDGTQTRSEYYYGTDGSYGAGKQGVIMIYAEQRSNEEASA